jgi:hypothetical protein
MADEKCYISKFCLNNEEIKPNPELAMWFYKKHIIEVDRELDPILLKYKFTSKIPTWKWELFAAILVGDVKKQGNGIDLTEHEVKTYQWRKPPEYQYHRNSWEEKLGEDKKAKHVCVWYRNSLKDLDVLLVEGKDVAGVFESWRPEIYETYEVKKDKDRCRKNLPRASIEDKGKLILKIRNEVNITSNL